MIFYGFFYFGPTLEKKIGPRSEILEKITFCFRPLIFLMIYFATTSLKRAGLSANDFKFCKN